MMDIEPWDPWREFERVREEADLIFERFFSKVQKAGGESPITFFPATDMIETGEDLRIFLSLPGMVEEDIDIGVEGHTLIVRGELEAPYDTGKARSHLAEWRYGYFERRIDLPAGLAPEDLSATYRGGVLTIVIPRKKA